MEKIERFKSLREGQVPKQFSEQHPVVANLILNMVDLDPKARPDCQTILSVIGSQILNIAKGEDVDNSVVSSPSEYLKCKRDRSQSMDVDKIEVVEAIEVLQTVSGNVNAQDGDDTNKNKKTIFVKLIENKLLILPNKHATKASLVYDLLESDLEFQTNKGEVRIDIDHPYLTKCTFLVSSPTSSPESGIITEFLQKIKQFF